MGGFTWAFTGCDGSGKTGSMSYFAALHASKGGKVRHFEGQGWYLTDGKGKMVSEPMDVDQWLSMTPDEYYSVMICIDEVQNLFDSARHMTLLNRISSYVVAQRRKLDLRILYTVQNWNWLTDRFRATTHLYSRCQDMRWTPYGKEQRYGEGERISLHTWDVKGRFTGEEWGDMGIKNLYLKPVWKYYDTEARADIYSGFTKVEVLQRKKIVDLRPPDEALGNPPAEVTRDINAAQNEELLDDLLANKSVNAVQAAKLRRALQRG